MRLAQLTLQGFKSFGNRTTVEFSPGVTAIVGPNGSGKSNLLDALKWATGGGRASAYRAGEKKELIFHGAAGKRGVGLAEVEVEFVDRGSSLKVHRTLAADGTSRLKLNGAVARFLDIDEALAGTGLGTSGLAVIGQGEVSQVLMADPEHLLSYVAEAAGVARLSGRREQTEQRLATAGQHLERLQDVLDELGTRLETLAHEADQAARHQALRREGLQLRYTAAVQREAGLRSEIGELATRAEALAEEIVVRRRAVAEARAALEVAKTEREVEEAAYREALADTEAKRGNLRVAETRLANARDRVASLEDRSERVARELSDLAELAPPSGPDVDVAALETALTTARDRLDAAEAARSEAHRAAADAVDALEAQRRQRAESERRRAAAQARRDELLRQLEGVEERLGELATPSTDVGELEAAARERRDALGAVERALDETRSALEDAQRAHAEVAAEAMALGRAVERQRAAYASRRGYAEGPRNALTSGIDGVVGSVADLLEVPGELQRAIGGALGRRSEYVVVDNAEVAQRTIAHVRSAGGYVTVLPLDLVQGDGRPSGDLAGEPGVVGVAAELVDVAPRFRPVVHRLLGGTVVVEDMDVAVRIARRRSHRPRLVTLDGDLVEASGAMSGGRRHDGVDVLGAAAELEQAERAAAEAAELEEERRATLQEVQARTKALLAERSEAADALAQAQTRLSDARERAAAEARARRDLEQRRADLQTSLDQVDVPKVDVAPEDEALLQRAAAAARDAFDRADAVAVEARTQHAEARRQHELAIERWRSFEVAVAQYERDRARRSSLRERSQELAEALAQARGDAAAAERAREDAAAAIPTNLAAKESAYRAAGTRVAERERASEEAAAAQQQAAEALEQLRVQLARRESALEIAEQERAEFPEGLEALDIAERTAKSRLRDIERELEEIGPVNHRAAQEHARERERHETLAMEMAQAELAAAELASTLERLDRETTTRLREAIAGMTERFAVHVQELFGPAAEGAIEVDTEGQRPVGLRIRLQPPGKQTQSLNLLSVGERTMGALAFLFALMAVEGSEGLPMAVLDEVDAPLDEANIRRYCTFLERLAGQGTQFVLITHQKATFEVADTLWGVTTEQGVSRVFSITRRDDLGQRDPAPAAS